MYIGSRSNIVFDSNRSSMIKVRKRQGGWRIHGMGIMLHQKGSYTNCRFVITI